jgi:site-specific DNA-adenine methylase
MEPRYTCLFSFYGGKSKLAHLYPPPAHPCIIEPFAGAAAYSLRYCDRDIRLYDVDPIVSDIWRFLLSDTAIQWVRALPDSVRQGDIIDDVLGPVPPGLLSIAHAEANRGTQGARGIRKQITKIGAVCWHRLKPRLLYWLPRIRHWQFRQASWDTLDNREATWFIDPPYSTPAGRRYRHHDINYEALAEWCRSRAGQVIVCENSTSTWLPFRPIARWHGIHSHYQHSQQSRISEGVWTK